MKRFGEDYTARVASFGTVADLAAIDDIGGALRIMWEEANPDAKPTENPWSVQQVQRIKALFRDNPDAARKQYQKLFYYYDGILGTKVSQSVHPAGIVISPLNLSEEYGVFYKDGELCLLLDMDELHEIGAAKYDFLILTTVTRIRDTCRYLGIDYPRTYEINWEDEKVWHDMLKSPYGIFQFEGKQNCSRKTW